MPQFYRKIIYEPEKKEPNSKCDDWTGDGNCGHITVNSLYAFFT